MKKVLTKGLTLAAAFAIGFAVMGTAHAEGPKAEVVLTADDQKIVYRKLGYHSMRDNMKAMGMILKAGVGDHASLAIHAAAMATTAKTISTAMKPNAKSTNEKTTVLPKIWEEWDKFNAGVSNFEKLTAELAAAAASGDMAATGAKMGEVGKACKTCHEDYRVKKDKK